MSRGVRQWWSRAWTWVIEGMARCPVWLATVVTIIVAVAVGYLVEVQILGGIHGRAWWLLLLGLVAGLMAAFVWYARHEAAMRRGVFLHLAVDTRVDRHRAEDAQLRALVADRWPRALVLPLYLDGTPGVSGSIDLAAPGGPADRLAAAIAEQARVAWIVAPAARGLTLLLGGPSQCLVPAGAFAAHRLAHDGHAIRLMTDDTSPQEQPFVDFSLPRPARRPHTAGVAGLLLVRDGEDQQALRQHLADSLSQASAGGASAVAGASGAAGAAVLPGPEQAGEPGQSGSNRACVPVELLVTDSKIDEKTQAYEKVVAETEAALSLLSCDEVFLQGSLPASLMFTSGYLAARQGLRVRSGTAKYEERPTGAEGSPSLGSPERSGKLKVTDYTTSDSAVPVTDVPAFMPLSAKALARRWRALLFAQAAAFGIGIPLATGILAMILEWAVANSQPQKVTADQYRLAVVVLAALVSSLITVGIWANRRLDRPNVAITHRADRRHTLANRVLVIPGHILSADAQTIATWITARFAEIVTALPGARDIEIDLGTKLGCPNGGAAITDPRFGLRKSLRASRQVMLRWDAQEFTSGP